MNDMLQKLVTRWRGVAEDVDGLSSDNGFARMLARSAVEDFEALEAAAGAGESSALGTLDRARRHLRVLLDRVTAPAGAVAWWAVPDACRETIRDIAGMAGALEEVEAPQRTSEAAENLAKVEAELWRASDDEYWARVLPKVDPVSRYGAPAVYRVGSVLPSPSPSQVPGGLIEPMRSNLGDEAGNRVDVPSPRPARLHALKLDVLHFGDVLNGRKNFEIRNDYGRGFAVGDVLRLAEVDARRGGSDKHTGRVLYRRVVYMTTFAQQSGFVVLGLQGSGPALHMAKEFTFDDLAKAEARP